VLVIDGKIRVCIGSESSGGTTSRRTRAAKLIIQEFAEEKEDRDREAFLIIGSHSKFSKE
jgi:hypothetical protein